MKPLPIRWKIALWTALLAGAVLVVFAAGTFIHLQHEQMEAVDLELTATARHIATLQEDSVANKTLDELVEFQPWLSVAMFNEKGGLVRRSPALPEDVARGTLADLGMHTVRGPAGAMWRVNSFRHAASTFLIAYSLEEVREISGDLLTGYALSLPLVLLLAAFGGWWVAGRALAPLREFTLAAESIRADQLHRRVPVPAANDEILRLAEVLNAMLGRLQKSFEQSQRFAADASHELRTPLTIISGEVERILRLPALPVAAEERVLSLQEEVGRLQRITEQMLLLAKFDAGTASAAHRTVRLSDLVRTACEDAELLAAARELSVDTAIEPDVAVLGDETHLRRLVLNLLDNAIRHADAHSSVMCALRSEPKGVRLIVGNAGAEIAPELRPHLFERFFRSDGARSRGGHGLGLSLCREIARSHGGEIQLGTPATPGRTEFVVTLPRPH